MPDNKTGRLVIVHESYLNEHDDKAHYFVLTEKIHDATSRTIKKLLLRATHAYLNTREGREHEDTVDHYFTWLHALSSLSDTHLQQANLIGYNPEKTYNLTGDVIILYVDANEIVAT